MKDQHHIPSHWTIWMLIKRNRKTYTYSSIWMKPILNVEFTRLKNFENLAYEFFNHHTIISSVDKNDIFMKKIKPFK